MKIAREIAGLSITAVLLSQCGCSASSFRNLFAKNNRSDLHTLEELDAKNSSKAAENAAAAKPADTKTASWNPFKRDQRAAEAQADSAATTASTGAGFWKNPFGENDVHGTDPFLPADEHDSPEQSEVKTADAKKDRETDDQDGEIARTSGTLDAEGDSSDITITSKRGKSAAEKSVLTAAELEVAEPLILHSGDQAVASHSSELEKQKIMQLEELLASGDFRKSARNARETAAKAADQAESRLSHSTAAIAKKGASAAEQARSVAKKGSAEFDEFFEELETEGSQTAEKAVEMAMEFSETDEGESDEELIANAQRQSDQDSVEEAVGEKADTHSRRKKAAMSSTADAVDLFGDSGILPEPGNSATRDRRDVEFTDNDAPEQSDFQWQASRKQVEKKSPARSKNGVRQASMKDDAAVGSREPETDSWLQDEIFAPRTAPKHPAKTVSASGGAARTAVRRRGQPSADPFVSGDMDGTSVEETEGVPAPAKVGDPEAKAEETVSEAILPTEINPEKHKASGASSKRPGLSTRSWLAIAAGLTIVGFLFLPARRKTGAQKPAALHS